MTLLTDISKMPPFWQAKAWILERTRFAKFGSKQLVIVDDVTGRVNVPPSPKSLDDWLSQTARVRHAVAPGPVLSPEQLIAEDADSEEVEIVTDSGE